MPGNGKVFISHAHENNDRCAPLLAALDAWGVDYWFDTQSMDAGDDLGERIQNAIASHDLFLRVCTQAAQSSYWMGKELGAFMGLQAADHKDGNSDKRRLVPLRLDSTYQFKPFELGTLYIDAVNKPQRSWLEELRRALGLAVSRTPSAPTVAPAMPAPIAPAGVPAAAIAPLLGPVTEARTWVVDPYGRGDHTSIRAAVESAAPGDHIHVFPGLYQEGILVNKPLDIAGQGDLGEIVIESGDAPALRFEAPKGRIVNLVLRNAGPAACVDIPFGRPELEGCDITSKGGVCLDVHSGAHPIVRKCILHHSSNSGVAVYDGGQGLFEANELFGFTTNQRQAVQVQDRSRVTLRGNNIHDCFLGVSIGVNSHATLEQNDIYALASSGVVVDATSTALLRGSQIHDNGEHGVYVSGRATLEDNKIWGLKGTGVVISAGGRVEARRNAVIDNRGYGVLLNGRNVEGIIEDNDLRNNGNGAIYNNLGASIRSERNQIQ